MTRTPWRRRIVWGLAGAVTLGSVCATGAVRHLRATSLLLDAIGYDPLGVTRLFTHPLAEERVEVLQVAGRAVRARSYGPRDDDAAPGVVLFHGIHHLGIDEPRFRRMARALAGAGFRVLTPELVELHDYRIEPASTDTIAHSIVAHARATRGKVGAWGISFGGGLLLIAATRPEVREALAYVVTLGAHSDLTRVARYYSGQPVFAPDGTPAVVPPHPYGARVLLHAYVERLFDAQSAPLARRALRLYVEDRFEQARAAARSVGGAARDALLRLLDGDARSLERDLTLISEGEQERWAEVSPHGKVQQLQVPTFLLHGAQDSVIPSLETYHLAAEVPPAVLRRVLVTPVLGHADPNQDLPATAYGALVSFISDILRVAGP